MSAHAFLPPSSAHIWGHRRGCQAWPALMRDNPPDDVPETQDQRDGHEAHSVGAALILGDGSANKVCSDNPEIQEAAELYAAYCTSLVTRDNRSVEWKLRITSVHEKNWGTPDFLGVSNDTLHVVDLKYGMREISAFENWQCLDYAAAAIGFFPGIKKIKIHIVQPRVYRSGGPIDTWELSFSDFIDNYLTQLKESADIATSSGAQTRTGKHCRDCVMRYKCRAALNAGAALFEVACEPVTFEPDAESLGLYYSLVRRASEQIGYILKGVEGEITARLKSGEKVSGCALEPAYGRLTWRYPVEEVIELANAFGVDISKPGVKTPTQAKKELPVELLVKLAHRPLNGLKLNNNINDLARRIFS